MIAQGRRGNIGRKIQCILVGTGAGRSRATTNSTSKMSAPIAAIGGSWFRVGATCWARSNGIIGKGI